MFHVVTGGSGSGKSEFAENELLRLAKDTTKYYIATMEPFGEETMRKIERHRKVRAGKGFETIECYVGLMNLASELGSGSVLLECMSNLVANEIYRPDGAGDETVDMIMQGIRVLHESCDHLVVVTNEVCSDGNEESEEMQIYKEVLAQINTQMAAMADTVTEVVYGIPVRMK